MSDRDRHDRERALTDKIVAFGQASSELGRTQHTTVADWASASTKTRETLADLNAAIDDHVSRSISEHMATFCTRMLNTPPAELLEQLERLASKGGAK